MPNFGELFKSGKSGAPAISEPAARTILFNGLSRLSPGYLERPCDGDEDECRARHFFGYWQDALASTSALSDDGGEAESCEGGRVDFLMVCPLPHWYSLGAGRSVMGLFYGGDRYIISFDGRVDGADRISVGLLSEGEGALLYDPDFDPRDLVAAAVYAATGREIKPYDREFSFVSVDGLSLYASGCAPFWDEGE